MDVSPVPQKEGNEYSKVSNCEVFGDRAIEAAADGSSDVIGMAYWWSNCIQLRWMLWAMCHGGDQSEDGSMAEEAQGMDEFDWVMKVGLPYT